ncbi:hypothetical protein MHY1_01090 [Methylovirgula sp. HY1]|nr:hypothetical protein MHY1_01090 [Methylovirgula sp. HY1]
METRTCGEWFIRVRPNRTPGEAFLGWAAKTEDLGSGPLEVDFSLDVFFEFGDNLNVLFETLEAQIRVFEEGASPAIPHEGAVH